MPLLQPGQSAFKAQNPINFGAPTASSIIPKSPTPLSGSLTSPGSTTPYVISGLKAAQPGTLNPVGVNTLKPSQIATPANQTVTTPTTTPVIGGPNNGGTAPQLPQAPVAPTPVSSSTASQSGTQTNTPSASGLLGTVAGFSQPDPGLTNLYNQQQTLTNQFANMTGNVLNTPSDLNYQTGRLNALQNTYNTAEGALANTYQANLAERGQNIGAAESALGTASTLTPSPYGQPLVNPATGQTISGGQNIAPTGTGTGANGAIQPNDPAYAALQQYAQMAANGQVSAIPSAWTSNPVINAQINQMAQTINPNYSPIASAAQGAATSANIQTGGTAATSAAASGLQQATQTYVSANTAYTAAQNQATNLLQVLNSTGINSNPQFINQSINALQNQLGSANYTSFITALTEMQQKYTTLLSTVGAQTPTVNGQQATAILTANSTPAQITAAIDALNQAAYAQLQPLYNQIGTYSSQLGGNSNANSTATTNFNW